MFFFEKKNQKTFTTGVRSENQAAVPDSARQAQKFFGCFFQKRTSSLACLILALMAHPALAAVTSSGPSGFKLSETQTAHASPAKLYAALHAIGHWLDPKSNDKGGWHNAAHVTLDLVPGGCLCEKLPNGGGARYMQVVLLSPQKAIILSGAPGIAPLAVGLTSTVVISFQAMSHGTQINVTYTASGYFDTIDTALFAARVDGLLGAQVQRWARFTDTRNADAPAAK
jgi:hypothetical protein